MHIPGLLPASVPRDKPVLRCRNPEALTPRPRRLDRAFWQFTHWPLTGMLWRVSTSRRGASYPIPSGQPVAAAPIHRSEGRADFCRCQPEFLSPPHGLDQRRQGTGTPARVKGL